MGALDFVMEEVQSRFGISGAKANSLLSGLLSFITQQSGGVSGFIDRFKSAGLGDVLSSWFSGATRSLSTEQVETVLGSSTLSNLASKAGISPTTAGSAIALMLPKLIQSIAPGGAIPTMLPSELMSYISGPTAAVAGGARQAVHSAERAGSGIGRFLWPLLALLAVILLGLWYWSHGTTPSAFNPEEQVRLATQKASAALAALKPGYSAQDLVTVLNYDIINFASCSAVIPTDGTDFPNKAAVAIKAAPSGSQIEIGGYTDNTGDAASNLQLSQQRADAVRSYLVAQGVDASALVAKGYGDTKPAASNDTVEGKFQNRRIEFTAVR
ncbi:MAG: OmpA family protein [Candidatus Sulfotelmatobacter sp.]